ncbi:MAG TPA: hypothetical protein VF954_06600, partial [Acidimicrobiales bacterium]
MGSDVPSEVAGDSASGDSASRGSVSGDASEVLGDSPPSASARARSAAEGRLALVRNAGPVRAHDSLEDRARALYLAAEQEVLAWLREADDERAV